MAKQRNQEKRVVTKEAPGKETPGNVIFAAVVCLAIGLGVGYYFGQQSAARPAAVPQAAQTNMPVQNPASFLQDEAGLKAALRANPKDLNALIQLGNLYYDHNRYREAVEWYGKALEIDPKNPNVRTDRGTSYWNLGQADAALEDFQKTLQVSPNHAQTLYNMGVVYLHGKNSPAEARKAWETLLTTNPNYPERAKVQEQIASLASQGGGAAAPGPGQGGSGSSGVEDLLQRMKNKQ